MKSLRLNKPGEFEFINTDFTPVLAPNEALIKVHRIGICGTDYHAYRGKQPFFSYPRVLGHELGAEIVALGDAVATLQIGDKVSVEPYLNCGECHACKRGHINCCENIQVMGVHTDGGMAEFVKVPAHKLHVSSVLSYDQLALVETLGIGAHAVERAKVTQDDVVLIIGTGPIGLSVLEFAKIRKAKVVVMDMSQHRLDFATQEMGADLGILVNPEFTEDNLREALGGELPTAVFDATGNPASMMKAFSFVAFAGRLTFVGLFQGEVTFNDPLFHRREMTLLASRNSMPNNFKEIIDYMEKGLINTDLWITHRANFDEIPTAIEEWLNPASGVIKAVVSL